MESSIIKLLSINLEMKIWYNQSHNKAPMNSMVINSKDTMTIYIPTIGHINTIFLVQLISLGIAVLQVRIAENSHKTSALRDRNIENIGTDYLCDIFIYKFVY